MKKIILFLFLFTISIEAQETFMLQPVVINPADASKFEMIQKKYAKNLAQKVKLFFLYVVTLYTINNINYSNNKFLKS